MVRQGVRSGFSTNTAAARRTSKAQRRSRHARRTGKGSKPSTRESCWRRSCGMAGRADWAEPQRPGELGGRHPAWDRRHSGDYHGGAGHHAWRRADDACWGATDSPAGPRRTERGDRRDTGVAWAGRVGHRSRRLACHGLWQRTRGFVHARAQGRGIADHGHRQLHGRPRRESYYRDRRQQRLPDDQRHGHSHARRHVREPLRSRFRAATPPPAKACTLHSSRRTHSTAISPMSSSRKPPRATSQFSSETRPRFSCSRQASRISTRTAGWTSSISCSSAICSNDAIRARTSISPPAPACSTSSISWHF